MKVLNFAEAKRALKRKKVLEIIFSKEALPKRVKRNVPAGARIDMLLTPDMITGDPGDIMWSDVREACINHTVTIQQ